MGEKLKGFGARAGVVSGVTSGLIMLGALLDGSFAADPTTPYTGTPESAVSDIGGTVTAIGAALLGVIVVAAGIMLAAKYIKKAASKA